MQVSTAKGNKWLNNDDEQPTKKKKKIKVF